MEKFYQFVESLSLWSGKICSFLIYLGIIMLSFEVIARYFFNSPTIWAHGYTQRFFGSYFIMIGAYTLIKGAHVRIDIIHQKFSLKIRTILDIINYLFLIFWSFILFKEGLIFFSTSFALREADEMALAHPVYPVKFVLIIGVLLILLQGIAYLIKSINTLIKGEELNES